MANFKKTFTNTFICSTAVLGCCVCCNVSAVSSFLEGAYVGADVLKTNYATKKEYGGDVFARNPVAFNFFAGYKFGQDRFKYIDSFFVEAGYEIPKNKSRTSLLGPGDAHPGGTIIPEDGHIYTYKSNIKTHNFYLGTGINLLVPKLNNTSFSALIGASSIKSKAQYEIISDNEQGEYQQDYIDVTRRTFIKRRLVAVLRIGINYYFSKNLSIRLNATWHKLPFNKTKSEERPNNLAEIRSHDSRKLSIGLSYIF